MNATSCKQFPCTDMSFSKADRIVEMVQAKGKRYAIEFFGRRGINAAYMHAFIAPNCAEIPKRSA